MPRFPRDIPPSSLWELTAITPGKTLTAHGRSFRIQMLDPHGQERNIFLTAHVLLNFKRFQKRVTDQFGVIFRHRSESERHSADAWADAVGEVMVEIASK